MNPLELKPNDFKQLPVDGARFEALVSKLLEAMGYGILEKPAVGADGGRDVLVERRLKDSMNERSERVVVQCKHFAHSGKAVGDKEVGVWQNAMTRYKARGYLLVTDSRVTENLSKSLRAFSEDEANAPRWAAFWDVDELILQLNKFPEVCDNFLSRALDSSVNAIAAVQSKLRLLANSQIKQFARGKYIPTLYVSRRLENDIVRFVAPESTIAELSRSASISASNLYVQRLKNHIVAFDERTATFRATISALEKKIGSTNSQIKEVSELLPSLKNHGRYKERKLAEANQLANLKQERKRLTEEKVKVRTEIEVRNQSRESGRAFVKELQEHLERCVSTANKLSGQTYFLRPAQYDAFSQSIDSVLTLLSSKYGEYERQAHAEISDSLRVGYVAANAPTILSEGGFVYELRDLLKNELDRTSRLFRNTLVVIDRAGSGKTNMICHLVNSLATESAIILLFGKEQFQEPGSIIEAITSTISKALGRSDDALGIFGRLLEKEGKFLTVFLDGINENRHIAELDGAIALCLDWAQNHRIKFVFTCRDIYWDFFNYESWGGNVHSVVKDELNQFSRQEYISALPLYLEFYGIICELADEAREACLRIPVIVGSDSGTIVGSDSGSSWAVRLA